MHKNIQKNNLTIVNKSDIIPFVTRPRGLYVLTQAAFAEDRGIYNSQGIAS